MKEENGFPYTKEEYIEKIKALRPPHNLIWIQGNGHETLDPDNFLSKFGEEILEDGWYWFCLPAYKPEQFINHPTKKLLENADIEELCVLYKLIYKK